MGATFPNVNLRDENSLSAQQYQVVIDGELATDETLSQITDGTMMEILTNLSYAFCDYYFGTFVDTAVTHGALISGNSGIIHQFDIIHGA